MNTETILKLNDFLLEQIKVVNKEAIDDFLKYHEYNAEELETYIDSYWWILCGRN